MTPYSKGTYSQTLLVGYAHYQRLSKTSCWAEKWIFHWKFKAFRNWKVLLSKPTAYKLPPKKPKRSSHLQIAIQTLAPTNNQQVDKKTTSLASLFFNPSRITSIVYRNTGSMKTKRRVETGNSWNNFQQHTASSNLLLIIKKEDSYLIWQIAKQMKSLTKLQFEALYDKNMFLCTL